MTTFPSQTETEEAQYRDPVGDRRGEFQEDELWRTHSDAVNGAVLDAWLSGRHAGRLLKTDLFGETAGTGFYPLLATHAHSVIGMDLSHSVALAARRRIASRFIGATCGPDRLKRMVEQAGFEVTRVGALLHCPRFLAMAMGRVLKRRASEVGRTRWLQAPGAFEALSRWPLRFLTGHFVTVEAIRQ